MEHDIRLSFRLSAEKEQAARTKICLLRSQARMAEPRAARLHWGYVCEPARQCDSRNSSGPDTTVAGTVTSHASRSNPDNRSDCRTTTRNEAAMVLQRHQRRWQRRRHLSAEAARAPAPAAAATARAPAAGAAVSDAASRAARIAALWLQSVQSLCSDCDMLADKPCDQHKLSPPETCTVDNG